MRAQLRKAERDERITRLRSGDRNVLDYICPPDWCHATRDVASASEPAAAVELPRRSVTMSIPFLRNICPPSRRRPCLAVRAANHELDLAALARSTEADVHPRRRAVVRHWPEPAGSRGRGAATVLTGICQASHRAHGDGPWPASARASKCHHPAAARAVSMATPAPDRGRTATAIGARGGRCRRRRELVAVVLRRRRIHRENSRERPGRATDAYEMQPAVIVMDMTMPVLDGVEATRLIKATKATRDAR